MCNNVCLAWREIFISRSPLWSGTSCEDINRTHVTFDCSRELCLQGIHTELPRRNMINLTSFSLGYMRPGQSFVTDLLDFFESAPRLRKIQLQNASPTLGGQTERLVHLGCLKRMVISGWHPPSLLFDHLLIPADAKLTTQVDSCDSPHLPRAFHTIESLPHFTIHVYVAGFHPNIQVRRWGGDISIIPITPRVAPSYRVLESLALFDLSKVERLRLAGGDLKVDGGCPIGWALQCMTHLCTLTISRCKNLSNFIPSLGGGFYCPKLEELVLDPCVDGEKFEIQRAVAMAAGRVSEGVGLKSIKIVSRDKFVQTLALKLKEYVSHVECSPRVALVSDDIDSGDEED